MSEPPDAKFLSLVRPKMPELDSLRGLAIIVVMLFHGFYFPFASLRFGGLGRLVIRMTSVGWLGVNLFFVLSGFLITGILLEARRRDHYYRTFYTRRALRILPAYYLILSVLLALGWSNPAYFGLCVVYLSNVTDLFGVAPAYGPLWSLAVEEHYYILWPLIVRRCTQRALAYCTFAICLAVPILRYIAYSLGRTSGLRTYTWFCVDNLAIGSALAVLLRSSITRSQVRRVCGSLLVGGAGLTILGIPFGILTRTRPLGACLMESVIGLSFSGALLLCLLIGSGKFRRFAEPGLFTFFGYISYGLYLLHMLIFTAYDRACSNYFPFLQPRDGHFDLVVVRFIVAGGLAVAVAYVSRRYFEERFLRKKELISARTT